MLNRFYAAIIYFKKLYNIILINPTHWGIHPINLKSKINYQSITNNFKLIFVSNNCNKTRKYFI